MRETQTQLGLVIGIFATVGIGLAVVGFIVTDWATVQFIAAASGASPQQFGPIFVAATALQIAATAFVVSLLLAGLVGLLFGSRSYDPQSTAAIIATGSLLGSLLLGFLTVSGIQLGVSGAAAQQTFTLGGASGPIVLTGLLAAIVGALNTYLGKWATE